MEHITIGWELLNNPIVQMGAGALCTLILFALGLLIQKDPKAHEHAEDLGDLAEELEPWVEQAAALSIPGAARAAYVRRKIEEWLRQKGIDGKKGRVLQKYAAPLMEAAVQRFKKRSATP